jgi:D-lyxose ketol-isomerase
MSCPKCGKESDVICSNDCGTNICPEHRDYHEDDDGKYKMGHALRCGNFKKMDKYWEKKKKEAEKELASDKYKC